jgi:hypothetical protein
VTNSADEFLELYQKDFEITGGGSLETFLGMKVEQSCKVIKLHHDNYIQKVLNDYKEYIKKSRRSTSGNLCLYNRSPVLWHSKLQKTTAQSTAEAEY